MAYLCRGAPESAGKMERRGDMMAGGEEIDED
jgi:hypothetical protein